MPFVIILIIKPKKVRHKTEKLKKLKTSFKFDHHCD